MRLIVALPHRIQTDANVTKVSAEGIHGAFTMLPRHLDHVVLLGAGILSYTIEDGDEYYVAVEEGVLTKVGDEVRVSTVAAVFGDQLGELYRSVDEAFNRLDKRDRTTRDALARIEKHVIQQLFEFEERS